ncbi:MAG: hypothetical protein HY001_04780 [Candidatus Portnoybacteria bacterium]|nr:hypothetical protein [Candidatus Portnoybacteria bacterium]
MSEPDKKNIFLEQKEGQELVGEQRKISPVEKATNALGANEAALKALTLTLEGKLPSPEELPVRKNEANVRGLIYRLRQTFPTITDIRKDLGRTIRGEISVSRGELDEKDWERAIRIKQEKYLAAGEEALDSLGEVYDEEGPLPSEENKERIAKDLEELKAIALRGQLSEDEARWFSQAIRASGIQPFDSQKEADFEKLSNIISAIETILPVARKVQGFSPGREFENTLISIKERYRIGSELRALLEEVRKPAGVIPEGQKTPPEKEEQAEVTDPLIKEKLEQIQREGIKIRIPDPDEPEGYSGGWQVEMEKIDWRYDTVIVKQVWEIKGARRETLPRTVSIPEVVKLNPDVFARIAEEQPQVEKPVFQQSIKQKGIKERISAFFKRFT